MRIPRFFAAGRDLDTLKQLHESTAESSLQVEFSEADLIKRVRSVLRLGRGHRLVLLDGSGLAYQFVIDHVTKSCLNCILENSFQAEDNRRTQVRLCLSLIKADRFEWCIEKLTELGVDEIVPLTTRFCSVRPDEKGQDWLCSRLNRWVSIAREAAEQCERPAIPHIVEPRELGSVLCGPEYGGITALRFICAERRQSIPLVEALPFEISRRDRPAIDGINSISLLIGPEGGFAAPEVEAAEKLGWMPVSLGQYILRSETAAIAAMSQVASILDIQKSKLH